MASPSDSAVCYSNPIKAKHELGWKAENNIYDMCRVLAEEESREVFTFTRFNPKTVLSAMDIYYLQEMPENYYYEVGLCI